MMTTTEVEALFRLLADMQREALVLSMQEWWGAEQAGCIEQQIDSDPKVAVQRSQRVCESKESTAPSFGTAGNNLVTLRYRIITG
jgi:hypothetical protein